jgi:hypothetical protein
MFKRGLLEDDDDGCAETLGDPDGEVEGPVDDSDEDGEEGALLTIGLPAGYDDGRGLCLRHLITQMPTSKARRLARTKDLKKAHCSNRIARRRRRGLRRDTTRPRWRGRRTGRWLQWGGGKKPHCSIIVCRKATKRDVSRHSPRRRRGRSLGRWLRLGT